MQPPDRKTSGPSNPGPREESSRAVAPVPGVFNEAQLGAALSLRLPGKSADGSNAPSLTGALVQRVIWVDAGSEVLVYLDSVKVKIVDGMILVSIDLESDQTGRATLVCAFAVGRQGDPAGLVAVTDELPRGNGLLAARWGAAVRNACWSALLDVASDVADQLKLAPTGIIAGAGAAQFVAGQPIVVTQPNPITGLRG